ncbi:hypothetical protein TrispH2_002105 [Trichoplax sp. H2]|nr:hypothetical protein TrispH2_002105 [Trichoplax sp. H2]|eukprot:RDD45753.1 hypothetical protein TrispH2_002105 [Trichoplax sp. H2]
MKSACLALVIFSILCHVNGFNTPIGVFRTQDDLVHQVVKLIADNTKNVQKDDENYVAVAEIRKRRNVNVTAVAYVESDLNSCSMPSSSIRSFCGTSYTSPTIMVKRLDKAMGLIANSFSTLQVTLGSTCSSAVKQILCTGAYPRCSSDSTVATYGSIASGCSGLSSCPANTISLNGQTGTQICTLSGRQISLTSCGRYSMNSLNPFQCGTLPSNITFPTWLIPELPGQSAAITNLRNTLSRAGIGTSCTNRWVRISCRNVPFCSSDSKKLLGVISRQECEAAINCLPNNLQAAIKLLYECNIFPDQNAQTYEVPPNQGYTNHASSVVVGSFLFYAICSLLSLFF